MLLAQTWKQHKDPTGYWISEKLDGVRYVELTFSNMFHHLMDLVRSSVTAPFIAVLGIGSSRRINSLRNGVSSVVYGITTRLHDTIRTVSKLQEDATLDGEVSGAVGSFQDAMADSNIAFHRTWKVPKNGFHRPFWRIKPLARSHLLRPHPSHPQNRPKDRLIFFSCSGL